MPRKKKTTTSRKAADRGRYSAKRKADAVLRMLRGEELDALSRELGVTAGTLSSWREQFLAGGMAGLKSRVVSPLDEEVRNLKAMIGDLTMRNELLQIRAARAEGDESPFPWWKPSE